MWSNFENKNIFRQWDFMDLSFSFNNSPTNNRTELAAIFQVLKIVNSFSFPYDVEIYSDSAYAINSIAKMAKLLTCKTNVDLLRDINNQLMLCRCRLSIFKVDGHSGYIDGNYHADRLAGLQTIRFSVLSKVKWFN